MAMKRQLQVASHTPQLKAVPLLLAACGLQPAAALIHSIEHEQRIITELHLEPIRRHRPPEQVALHFIAAMFAQEVQLLMGFHTLGDDRQVEAVGHGDNGAGDLRILFAGGQAIHERAVDLQHVDGELLEVVER